MFEIITFLTKLLTAIILLMLTAEQITFYDVTSKYKSNILNLGSFDETSELESTLMDDTTTSTTDDRVTVRCCDDSDEVSRLLVSHQAVTTCSFHTRETKKEGIHWLHRRSWRRPSRRLKSDTSSWYKNCAKSWKKWSSQHLKPSNP